MIPLNLKPEEYTIDLLIEKMREIPAPDLLESIRTSLEDFGEIDIYFFFLDLLSFHQGGIDDLARGRRKKENLTIEESLSS